MENFPWTRLSNVELPKNQKPLQPVASTQPQAMNGAKGMIRPSSQA
jgi:hypothetical protein